MTTLNPLSLNAFRWTALALGLYYGYSKHASLVQFVETRNISFAKQNHEDLVKEAKIAYEAQYNREQAALAKEQGVDAIDANSYKFNAEKWINFALSQSEK